MSKPCDFLLFLGIIKKYTPLAENAHPHDLSLNSIKAKKRKGSGLVSSDQPTAVNNADN